MVPEEKKSPYDIIQESLWPDRWKCSVACILLNRTSRSQVDKVIDKLFELAPTPRRMASLSNGTLIDILTPLGFFNKRAMMLKTMSEAYIQGKRGSELPGIGKYGSDSDTLFFTDAIPDNIKDGPMIAYADWKRKQNWKQL